MKPKITGIIILLLFLFLTALFLAKPEWIAKFFYIVECWVCVFGILALSLIFIPKKSAGYEKYGNFVMNLRDYGLLIILPGVVSALLAYLLRKDLWRFG